MRLSHAAPTHSMSQPGGYRRRPGLHRLHDPYRQIYRARGVGVFVVRAWIPSLKCQQYLGTARTLGEAQKMLDTFLREKGLK